MVSTDGAYTAFTIWPQAQAINNQIAAVNTALADSATIGGGSIIVNDPITQVSITLQIANLTVAESAQVFNTMLTVLAARQAVWNADIAAIT